MESNGSWWIEEGKQKVISHGTGSEFLVSFPLTAPGFTETKNCALDADRKSSRRKFLFLVHPKSRKGGPCEIVK